ncbi:MAG: class I SAM-dependent methyltransferase [Planctomycetota bacterium]|nr:class I SAM-dependent methyltransferase [Planctomycetota bacterium]
MPHYRLHRDLRSSHQQISRRVRVLGMGPVLDVGAAQGMLGQLLTGSGIAIDAVEPNPQWADACRPNYRNVIVGTIEAAPVPDAKYRVIVCADVLEHTADPVGVLKKIRPVAADGAVYLISVPNVAHLAVRAMLLVGRFPKMERGILDKTHLQFFTRDTARQMLQSAGLRVRRVSATGVPLDEVFKTETEGLLQRFLTRCQHIAISILPRLFAMQFIFEAEHADASPSE